jgi:nucleoside-diphosphate-sugar epimerase
MKSNLITGSSGFIGGHLVEYLFEQGEISKGIFRKGSLIKLMDKYGVQGLEADLLEPSTLTEAVEGVDVIYNLVSPVPDTEENTDYLRVDVEGTRNLLDAARNAGVKTFIHLSTLDVYGFGRTTIVDEDTPTSPGHPYQVAKLESENVLLDFAQRNPNMAFAIVRAAKAIGARDETITLPMMRMAESGRLVLPVKTDRRMSFSHPKDIAAALYNIANAGTRSRKIYLVKSLDATILEVARAILGTSKKNVEIKYQGIITGRSLFPAYTISQIKASMLLKAQQSWQEIGYSPIFDLNRVSEEVRDWYKREPWITEGVSE